jgi:predicted RNA-binding protein with PUA-like domain
MNYWLMKSEPDTFSIDHLMSRPGQVEHWDGVRNYQVRNMMRDQMQVGDQAFFYHSSCKVPAIVGIVEIVKAAYPDHTAFDPKSAYYDPKSDPNNPRWFMVDVKFLRKLEHPITLKTLKQQPFLIESDLPLLRKGSRLSIIPISSQQWDHILSLASST